MFPIQLEYIWIDGDKNLRSKTKVLKLNGNFTIDDLPDWNYDGSSTNQASGNNSEIIIKPVFMCKDPFKGGYNKLVLCSTWSDNTTPHVTNIREPASQIFNKHLELEPMFGLEQEFFVMHQHSRNVISKPFDINLDPQGKYYCGIGIKFDLGRVVLNNILQNCIYANLSVTGSNLEVAPGQMEVQICEKGIAAADHLYMLRYIINRTLEVYCMYAVFDAKPLEGDWNGSGCHCNFSTLPMRTAPDGINYIYNAVEKLKLKHELHISNYGDDNDQRLTGQHETSDMNTFSSGVGDRTASIRIPNSTVENNCGYLEDRRPSSSCDPYVVTSLIFDTCVND